MDTGTQESLIEEKNLENADNLPPPLTSILESLKKEGIYLGQEDLEVKPPQLFEQKAIHAVNEAFTLARDLYRESYDIARGAHLLEKIQMAAAEAERAAYIVKTARARKCYDLAHRIAIQGREFFHALKDRKNALRQRVS